MIYSAAVKTSARSKMSRIVAAACCVYFLLPSFCLRLFALVAFRRVGFSHGPPWHVSSLKCSFDGTFVRDDNEGPPHPAATAAPEAKLQDACTQFMLCRRTGVCTHLFVFVVEYISLRSLFSPLLFILLIQRFCAEACERGQQFDFL